MSSSVYSVKYSSVNQGYFIKDSGLTSTLSVNGTNQIQDLRGNVLDLDGNILTATANDVGDYKKFLIKNYNPGLSKHGYYYICSFDI